MRHIHNNKGIFTSPGGNGINTQLSRQFQYGKLNNIWFTHLSRLFQYMNTKCETVSTLDYYQHIVYSFYFIFNYFRLCFHFQLRVNC